MLGMEKKKTSVRSITMLTRVQYLKVSMFAFDLALSLMIDAMSMHKCWSQAGRSHGPHLPITLAAHRAYANMFAVVIHAALAVDRCGIVGECA